LAMRITGASWLSDNALLLIGIQKRSEDPITSARLVRGETRLHLAVNSLIHSVDRSGTVPVAQWVAVAQGRGSLRAGGAFELVLSAGTETMNLDTPSVALIVTDIRSLVRKELTALGPAVRNLIVEFLAARATDADEGDVANRLRLSRSLNLTRDMLRERLPLCELSPNRIEGLAVEAVIALDDLSFYIEGWLCDGESSAVRVTAISPEGTRYELLGKMFRYGRPDAEEFFRTAIGDQRSARYGFICYFRVSAPSLLPIGWLVEMETAAGTVIESTAPARVTDHQRIRAELLNDFAHDDLGQTLRRAHISPALGALQLSHSRRIVIDATGEFGIQPVDPLVSVIVPLYTRIDLLEHQMAGFAGDRDWREAELIYVLDSPELKSELLTIAGALYELYRVPFKVLVLSENSGFSTANNLAAACARGRLLLLMNSDVIPIDRGWLSKLTEFYQTLERPGALGPKLIYEDKSIQHAGLFFERSLGSTAWMNEHYYKGLHSDLPAANATRQVPAVTGACLLIESKLFAQVGGLSGAYLQGDYEDSDLCLRLSEAGRENWYFPHVRLYHLEGQSYLTAARRVNYEYNRWLFNEIWGGRIEHANDRVSPFD
jgi:GT2 family glycosyltransferase